MHYWPKITYLDHLEHQICNIEATKFYGKDPWWPPWHILYYDFNSVFLVGFLKNIFKIARKHINIVKIPKWGKGLVVSSNFISLLPVLLRFAECRPYFPQEPWTGHGPDPTQNWERATACGQWVGLGRSTLLWGQHSLDAWRGKTFSDSRILVKCDKNQIAMLYNIILKSIFVRPTFWQPFIALLTYISKYSRIHYISKLETLAT